MDHVILNHFQVTWTTPELAPPLLTTTPHQREDVSAFDRFNVHRYPTRRVFSGTGLELVTRQATPPVGIFCPRHCLIHETKNCSRRGKLPLLTRFLTLLEDALKIFSLFFRIVESELSGISNALATSTFLSPSSTDSITFFLFRNC
ncbi:uncharacterized protein TNCV_3397911 [Trichonephila clavipes]|nr:uncharacterized protein TNCV_3397911 [Trichonephila clavipes]